MQVLSGIRKEFREFFRTFRFIGPVIAMLFFAFLDPLMNKYLFEILKMSGMEITENMSGMLAPNFANSMMQFVSDVTQIGLLVLMLVMMRAAGGDIKNQSCVIPLCSGLKRKNMCISKLIFYPVYTIVAVLGSYSVAVVFSGILHGFSDIKYEPVLKSAFALTIYFLFILFLYFFFGILTARPGICVGGIFAGITVLSVVISLIKWNKYNPFALINLAIYPQAATNSEYFVAIAITLFLIFLLFALTILAFEKKKIK